MQVNSVDVLLSFLGKVEKSRDVRLADVQEAESEFAKGGLDGLIEKFIRLAIAEGNETNVAKARAYRHVATNQHGLPAKDFREHLITATERRQRGQLL